MADVNSIQEFSIGNYVPHSVAVGNFRYLWVTTDSKAIIRLNPNAPDSRTTVDHSGIPPLSAGVMKDPQGAQRIWFAAPAQQKPDPIMSMETVGTFPVSVYPLEDDAKAESIKLRTTDTGSSGTPVLEYSLLFAEPQYSYVGIISIPAAGGQIDRMPVQANTWLWDVAVTTTSDKKTHTYWITGQKRTTTPVRTENGLYRRSPGQQTWERFQLPRGPEQKPFYVIADTAAVWVTATNPNQVLRFDLNNLSWRTADLGTAVPQQLTFGTNGEVWVASSQGLHEFDRNLSGTGSMVGLPNGGGAKGICVGTNGELWYTNPTRKTVGRYPIPAPPFGAASLVGRTQVVAQGESVVHMKDHVERPLVAEYVANGRPVPGIPLTCRITAEGATFDDGTRERVILTDQRGRVVLPAVDAGNIEEEAILSVGLGDSEPHAATRLNITPS
ncbi:hypothetical protein [Saccharothrix sp. ST-888]|uniref:hypothetical protein n=1 Tax=Saccharothrix sp. ST-888 TaxID=1427391 RepID=UPI0005ED3A57|nr:hypothetical protein [Saccharothrix sp. ST-888]KJK56011.1 hypothetical protein UK12_25250 [Saccharothrix sp. ST-888]